MKTIREQLESINKIMKENGAYRSEYLMPFGKYKGTPLSDIDHGYLEWAYDITKDSRLRREIEKVIG